MKIHAAVFAGWLGTMALAVTAAGAVTIGNASRVGNQLQFTVTGESNAGYIIEGSTNLQHWQPVLSNRDANSTRLVNVTNATPRSYYRARIARSFTGSLAARGFIDLKGNNLLSDSFDSANTNYSTGGRYDVIKRRDGGDVAAYFGLTNSLNVGNAAIYGKLITGPGGSAAIGVQGAAGSAAWVENPINNGTIQPGWSSEDMDPWFPSVPPPSATAIPMSGSVGGTNYPYVLGNENYRQINFAMNTNILMVTGRATFWVQDDMMIGGSAKIVVTPGGSLTLYVGMPTGSGSVANIAGAGVINQNASALAFQYYGLPSNMSVTLIGNGSFVGTIYAPNADLTLSGGGVGGEDFSGAAIGKTITINGHFKFHHDENLAQAGPLF